MDSEPGTLEGTDHGAKMKKKNTEERKEKIYIFLSFRKPTSLLGG